MVDKFKNIGKRTDLPTAAIKGVHIELFSNREAFLDGIKGVMEYNDCYIKLNVGRGTMDFFGSNLEISSLECGEIVIDGKIEKIEFLF